MPTYRYRCAKCGDELEIWQSFEEKPKSRHAGGCGGRLTKVLSPAGIVLKGSGFYKTDSRAAARSGSKGGSNGSNGSNSSSSESNGSGSGDAKPATKSDKTSSGSGSGSSSGSSSGSGSGSGSNAD